jgi:allantoinase
MARNTADLVGWSDRGRIAPGARADLVAFAPQEEFVVDPAELAHRHPLTPYAGQRLTGVVRRTWLAGEPVVDATCRGQLVSRP